MDGGFSEFPDGSSGDVSKKFAHVTDFRIALTGENPGRIIRAGSSWAGLFRPQHRKFDFDREAYIWSRK
jgi:hypothetical protein